MSDIDQTPAIKKTVDFPNKEALEKERAEQKKQDEDLHRLFEQAEKKAKEKHQKKDRLFRKNGKAAVKHAQTSSVEDDENATSEEKSAVTEPQEKIHSQNTAGEKTGNAHSQEIAGEKAENTFFQGTEGEQPDGAQSQNADTHGMGAAGKKKKHKKASHKKVKEPDREQEHQSGEMQDENPGKKRRPMRQEEERYRISTKHLWIIMGVLWFVLIMAMLWQGYYESHTYKKGELATIAEENPIQRRRFLEEPELLTPAIPESTESSSVGVLDKTGANQSEDTMPDDMEDDPVQTEEGDTDPDKILDLKESLIGVLPGVR